jgi:hypothetical protein
LPKIEDTEKRFLSPTEITLLADIIDPATLDHHVADTLNPPWDPSDVDAMQTSQRSRRG